MIGNNTIAAGAPWSPARLSPLAWWRADLGVSLVSTKVAAWAGRGSLGVTLTQSTDANRPTWNASGARGGQPYMEATATGQLLTSASVTLPREVAIWVVTGTVTTAGFAVVHQSAGVRTHYLYLPGVAAFNVTNAAGSLFFTRFSSWTTANRGLLGIYDGTSVDVYSNNVNANGAVTGAAFASSNISGTLGLFASPDGVNPSAMQVYEAAIFPALSLSTSAARRLLRDYELARYG